MSPQTEKPTATESPMKKNEKDRSYQAWLDHLKLKFGLDREQLDSLSNIQDLMQEVDRLTREARARDKATQN